jgi:hypothetical protein
MVSYEEGDGMCVDLLYLTLAANQGSIRVHLNHLLRQRTVGTGIGRGGHDDRQIEQLAKLSMSHDILFVESSIPVASKLVKSDLEVEDEKELKYVSTADMEAGSGRSQDEPSCFCQCAPMARLEFVRFGLMIIEWYSSLPSPRTALKRLAAKNTMLAPNFILKVNV